MSSTLVKTKGGAEVTLDNEFEIKRFQELGIKSLHFLGKDSPYDIFKDNDGLYTSYRSMHNRSYFGFSRIAKVLINDNVVYEDKNVDTLTYFEYNQVLNTYNVDYLKDLNIINDLIFNLENKKDMFKEIFDEHFLNRNTENYIEQYRSNYINVLNEYKNIISNESFTPAEIRNAISKIECLDDENRIFEQHGFSNILYEFEKFVSNSSKETSLNRFNELIENLNSNDLIR